MKKTIKLNDKEIVFQCDGKDKNALTEEFYLLQDFVVESFEHLKEGALSITNKKIYREEIDRRIKSVSRGMIGQCREIIEINGTIIDSSFGIINLCEDSLESVFIDGSVLVRKKLRVRDIEKAIDNIQLLINYSKIKPKKER